MIQRTSEGFPLWEVMVTGWGAPMQVRAMTAQQAIDWVRIACKVDFSIPIAAYPAYRF